MKAYILTHKKYPPKTRKEIKAERVQVINEFMEGNLLRFLRRHYRQAHFELVYSKYIKKWKKTNPKLVKILNYYFDWPNHVVNVVNIMRTLEKYYGYEMEERTLNLAITIDDLFEEDIYNYDREHRNRLISSVYLYEPKLVTAQEALKEHKARGFIESIDFEDHDWKYAHVMSNVDRELMYPYNFDHPKSGHTNNTPVPVNIEIGLTLVGVQGYTRMVIPKTRNTI